MLDSKLITIKELSEYLEIGSGSAKAQALFRQQIENWEFAKENYNYLKSIKKKTIKFDGFDFTVQFNPGRIISSSAKVDAKSIKERECFLCLNNLPNQQKGITCQDNYVLLLNPFPIFEEHFTIPKLEHEPQAIKKNFGDLLKIAKEIGDRYRVFYNGPKCGASAPDHMHFQASLKNSMPLENESSYINKNSKDLLINEKVRVAEITNYLRNCFLIESDDLSSSEEEFGNIYNSIKLITASKEEPLMNIIVTYSNKWSLYIFPRAAHRPRQYFAHGSAKLLLSPAAVDLGGLLITPREEDFEKISKEDIIDIFEQTTINNKTIKLISENYCKLLLDSTSN